MPIRLEDLELIAATREVILETRSGDRAYRTTIWVAVDDGNVYLRSVRGKAGGWYRRAIGDSEVALQAGDNRFLFRAIPATDPESVERASAAFRKKYRKGQSLEAMLRPQVLDTTLRLEPLD